MAAEIAEISRSELFSFSSLRIVLSLLVVGGIFTVIDNLCLAKGPLESLKLIY